MKEVIELFTKFSIKECVFFIVLFSLSIKGVIDFSDWAKERLRKRFNKKTDEEHRYDMLINQMEAIIENQKKQNNDIRIISNQVNILLNSDKDDIKAWITEKHHYFCYKLGYIDDFNLDCIEKRFGHYKEEHGNSFVESLMGDIRRLPRISTDDKKEN